METTLTGTLETRSDSEPLSVKVVREVAQKEGVDPTELDAPLYDVINPEALDELFEPRRNGEPRFGAVTFTYHGYDIVVEHGDDDGGLTITLEDSGASPGSANGSPDRSGGDSAPNASHYCLDCDWKLDDEGYSTSERSGLAISHHVETGHTVEAADSDERSASSDAVEGTASPVDALEDAEDEPAVAVSDDSVVTN
ncbi:HalOD1 output domain-containing protein [Halostagnicola kamekurae]|uniref:Halobacterial output domain-containing protein n=1 Tax=Halostagnicola kamekurae TaxID=619731 RepID=A0A1I6S1F5_9EURY|nr:HalOD1 output domain-containing protein [Halostagnicola kamekurae]SFS70746.1 hypothetical protein SAMN04488556_2365 [Halostagnicola kamekurae]